MYPDMDLPFIFYILSLVVFNREVIGELDSMVEHAERRVTFYCHWLLLWLILLSQYRYLRKLQTQVRNAHR